MQCWGLWWPALTSVLPEGSCTELPRGRSLCPSRGSSVQDASGWESAGSEAAWWPQHSPHRVLGSFSTYPHSPQRGAWLWAKEKAGSWLSAFSKKQGCFSYATKSAGSGLPNIPRHLGGKKRDCGSSYRIKLDLTPQQLKEVTVLTPALPRVSLGCSFSRLAGVSPGNNPNVQII